MKADRRHELQTNELANWFGTQIEKHRGHLPAIIWAGVALVAGIVLVSIWSTRQGTSTATAWEEFYQIGNVDLKVRPKRLKELAERYPDTEIALWAQLDLADVLCYEGHNKLDIDREIAKTNLKEAQQTYAMVLQSRKALPEMTRRAALAEAKCWELMGDRAKAIETYKSVAKQFASSDADLAKDAASRASDLEQPEAAEFYKWLAEYKPPATRPFSLPGLGPNFPPFESDMEKSHGSDDSNDPGKDNPKSEAKEPAESKPDGERPKADSESTPPAETPSKTEPEKKAPDQPEPQ